MQHIEQNRRPSHDTRNRGARARAQRRSGFTLTELLVAIGILIGMMAIMAMVFSTATRSSGQAQTSTGLYRQLRQIAQSIETELESMDPAEAIMGVAGVNQLAYRTPDDAASARPIPDPGNPLDDYHRADMLMLVSKGPFEPYVYQPGSNDDFDTTRLVVYGQANIGKLEPAGTSWMNIRYLETNSTTAPSPIPVSQWHLARRVIGFPVGTLSTSARTGAWPLTGPEWTGAAGTVNNCADVYALPYQDSDPLVPQLLGPVRAPKGFFRYTTPSGTLQLAHYDLSHTLSLGFPPSFPPEPCAFDAASGNYYLLYNGYWYMRPVSAATNGPWVRQVQGAAPPPLPVNINHIPIRPGLLESATLPQVQHWVWPDWFRDVSTTGRGRSWIDPAPPMGMAPRMAAYFLPGCTDFKVEFTWDDPREIALDAATREPVLFDWNADGTAETPAPQPINWIAVPPGEIWVWSQLATETGNYDPESGDLRDLASPWTQRWPRAIRITLRAVDPSGRLPDPVTWTIAHCWD